MAQSDFAEELNNDRLHEAEELHIEPTDTDLFEQHSIVIVGAELNEYSYSWHKPLVVKDLARYDE